jgi:hypothetical protein
MRMSVDCRYDWRTEFFSGLIAEHSIEVRPKLRWWPLFVGYKEWTAQWVDGQLLQIRVPIYSASRPTPQFAVILGGRTIGTYEPNMSIFWHWFTDPVWKTTDGDLRPQRCRIFRLRNALRDGDGRLQAVWKLRRGGSDGVVRASASTEMRAVTFAIMMCRWIVL